MKIIQNIAAIPNGCLALGMILALFSLGAARSLLGALLEMHRSKNAVKKLKAQYTLWQRLCLWPVVEQSRHALRFCRRLAVVHHIRALTIPVLLILRLLDLALPLAWSVAAGFLLLDVPVLLIHGILWKRVWQRDRRYTWRFRKYHNTPEHEKLV